MKDTAICDIYVLLELARVWTAARQLLFVPADQCRTHYNARPAGGDWAFFPNQTSEL